MVKQYPDTLKYTAVATATKNTSTGNWTSGSAQAEKTQECRAESSTGNGYLTNPDGTRIDFSWIVYMPLTATKIAIGTTVNIYTGSELKCTDTVKRFARGQLNCRVWL